MSSLFYVLPRSAMDMDMAHYLFTEPTKNATTSAAKAWYRKLLAEKILNNLTGILSFCNKPPEPESSILKELLFMRLPSKPSWRSSANTFPGTPRHLLMPQSSLMISPQPTELGKQQCDVHCTGQLSVQCGIHNVEQAQNGSISGFYTSTAGHGMLFRWPWVMDIYWRGGLGNTQRYIDSLLICTVGVSTAHYIRH